MSSALPSTPLRSLFTFAASSVPSSSASSVSLLSGVPLSPSSARRSVALFVGQLSALLAIFYYLCGRVLPWLDWVSALGVEAIQSRSIVGLSTVSAGKTGSTPFDVDRRRSSFSSPVAPSPLFTGRSLLAPSPLHSSASSISATTAPLPSARMAALRSRSSNVKAVRMLSASPAVGQRSLSQPSHNQPSSQQSIILSPRKQLSGFSLPSLLSPPLSRSPSAPPSPRSPPITGAASLSRAVHRSTGRLIASLRADEDSATLAARVQLSNVLATMFAVGSLVMFLCMRALVSTSWSSLPLMAATLVCPLLLALVPALNHYGHTTVSRLLLVLLVNAGLFLFTCSTPGHGFSTLFYGCMPLPLLLFDATLASLPFLLSVSVPLVFHLLVTCAVYSSSLYTLNSFTSSVILSAVLLHLVSSYQSTHQSLLSASRSSRAAHVAMTSLMHSISHELRTPLNAVCGYAELLMTDGSLAAPHQDMVKTIADNADALTKLVSDFLTFSSSSSGQLRVDAVIMDVEEMLDACVASHALAAHKKGLELVLEVAEDVPALVVGDGLRMREVLSNLISNSIKASSAGCIHIRVSVDQQCQPLSSSATFSSTFALKFAAPSSATVVLRFDVRDEGVGITGEQQTKLFQPFQSINPGTSSTQSASSSSFGNSRGLGLAICHSLVQLMGGSIGVVSAPETGQKGSLFSFTVQVHMVDMGEDASPAAQPVSIGGQLLDAFDVENSDRKHTPILPVSEGNESEEDDEVGSAGSFGPRPTLSLTLSCLASPLFLPSSLVRQVLLVSPNRTARDVYARIFLQTRGWLVSLCEDEHEARLRLFDSPCQTLRQIDPACGVSRATSSPSMLDDLSTSAGSGSGSVSTSSASTPRLFDCIVLDQVAGMDLAAVQRFALNIQSRLDIPCVVLKMANASSPLLHERMVSGRLDESRNCTPHSSPHSETLYRLSLFDTTDESLHSAGTLSPACPSSITSFTTSSPFNASSPLPCAPFLPRPPSLQKPHYNNITPPASHAQQLHSLVCMLVKPVKRKVLVSKVRVLMEQARQRYASKRRRDLRDRMQFEQEVAHQQAAAVAAAAAPHNISSSSHHETDNESEESWNVTDRQPNYFNERSQLEPMRACFDLSGLPLLPAPSVLSLSAQQSCPPEPLSLASLTKLARESSGDSRPSPSMLRSLDRLTAAARSISAPAAHAVFLPSRPASRSNSPIREECEARRTLVSNHHQQRSLQHQDSRGSPSSVASTTSHPSSNDSPSPSGGSSSRSSSSASSGDSPDSAESQQPRSSHTQSHPHHHSALSFQSPQSHCCSMPASPPTSLSQLRVLVAEDTVTNQKIIGRMLERIGVHHVTIVNDGRECLQAVMGHNSSSDQSHERQQPPQQYHCILMDLLMPVLDGWQATERLRAAGYDLPIIALSASAMKSDRVRCDEVGCSAFLSKPTKLADLKDTLERLVLAQR